MSWFRKGSRIRKSKGSRVQGLPCQTAGLGQGFKDSSEFKKLDPSTPRPLESFRSSRGFTAIEAVIIVVILSILTVSAVVSYRLTNQDKATIAADQLIADIQYVQMRAMGIGSTQNIAFANGSNGYSQNEYSISGDPGTKRLPDKDGRIVVTGTNFSSLPYNNILYFNSLGEPCLAYNPGPPPTCTSCGSLPGGKCQVSVGVSAPSSRIVTVHAVTGKVE
jgi:type II secretory pathway pseudopilin PulG